MNPTENLGNFGEEVEIRRRKATARVVRLRNRKNTKENNLGTFSSVHSFRNLEYIV
jgi:hypothetical protein